MNEENFKTIYSQFFPQGGKTATLGAEPARAPDILFLFTPFPLSLFKPAHLGKTVKNPPDLIFGRVLFHHHKEMNLINSQ